MRHGFSLVELSIVLVILGLLTGGILAGQSLIRAAELRSITTEYSRYQSALMAFRDKYFAYPGDMPNATAFWGTAAGCPNTASNTLTCNGDGDGRISYDNSSPMPSEGFRAWQHMANAGMIEGAYTGQGGDDLIYRPGLNAARARLANGVWALWWLPGHINALWDFGPKQAGTQLAIGSIIGGWPGRWVNPILKPEEAWNIDTKLDDGKPFTGSINTMGMTATYAPNCTTGDSVPVATANATTYRLDHTGVACLLIMRAD